MGLPVLPIGHQGLAQLQENDRRDELAVFVSDAPCRLQSIDKEAAIRRTMAAIADDSRATW
jgi:hypothetical protein